MTTPVSTAPVCVTGASGYCASHIVRDLLARGYRVRGTVRNPSRTSELQFLRDLPGAAERLELVAGDLMSADGWNVAVAGCEAVMHTASPYVIAAKYPQRDLVDPAVNGTRFVLEACGRAGVRRVVLTSSVAAITDEPEHDRVLTEADWNTKSSLRRNAYYYSKVLAEREAWRIVGAEQPGFDLVVINPFMVIGPSLSRALNTSPKILVDMATGAYPGIFALTWGFVDVRDVAEAHIRGMETPGAAGRYLCAGERLSMREVVRVMRDAGVRGKLPGLSMEGAAGTAAVKLLSYFQPAGVGSYLRTHLGRVPSYDNGKIRRELGQSFRPARTSILDTVTDLRRWGHLPPA